MTGLRHLFLLALPLAALFPRPVAPAAAPPAAAPLPAALVGPTAREVEPGGFVLYQPFNHADGQVADGTFTHDGKVYTQTIVRWGAVGFLRVEAATTDTPRTEHWFLSDAATTSTESGSHVPFVNPYFWPGRSTPTTEKHVDWNDLPIRFERRNDLSGAADLAEFVLEIEDTYGFDVSATGDKFTRWDGAYSLGAGY